MICRFCGAGMVVIDAHFDSGCSQQLMDYECPACQDGYSETCWEQDDPDDFDGSENE